MSVVRRKRHDRYAIVPNAVAEDERLSFAARGMLVYLLAKPDNWEVNVEDLRRAGKIGRDKTYAILKQLIAAGYIRRDVSRDASGRITSQDYVVHDDAVPDQLPLPENPEVAGLVPENPEQAENGGSAPLPEKPDPEKPDTGFQDGTIKTPNQQLLKSTTTQPPSRGFDTLWQAWALAHKPQNRKAAESLWLALPSDDQRRHASEQAAAYQRMKFLRSEKPKLITYLKERGWRDLVDAPPLNHNGLFRIDRSFPEEWEAWMGHARETYGVSAVESVRKDGFMLRDTRWPPDLLAQTA